MSRAKKHLTSDENNPFLNVQVNLDPRSYTTTHNC